MKKYIFAFIFAIPMVARAHISSEIMCFGSGGVKSVNFEIRTYYDSSTKFSFGFVRYQNSKQKIPLVLSGSIGETLDKNMPDQTTNTWVEVYNGRVTGEYEMISQGTGVSSMIYTKKQGNKKVAFLLNADAITSSGCQW